MNKYWIYIVLIAMAVLSRVVPHFWNFAPVTAVAIVAALYLPFKQAIGLTLVVRFLSDLIIGFFGWKMMIAVYLSHLFGAVLGNRIKNNKTFARLAIASVTSSLVFFLVTNFAYLYSEYNHNISGVILAYTNGLPFLRGTLLGDMFYTLALVYGFEAVLGYNKRKADVILKFR